VGVIPRESGFGKGQGEEVRLTMIFTGTNEVMNLMIPLSVLTLNLWHDSGPYRPCAISVQVRDFPRVGWAMQSPADG